jgi:hypothetical protein
MGYAFITRTVPEAVRGITRLADGIEKLNTLLEQLLVARQHASEAGPATEEEHG